MLNYLSIVGRKKKVVIVAVFILALSGLFCWFEIRPSQIRKLCSNPNIDYEQLLGGKIDSSSGINLNSLYRVCLARHGMKPEDLSATK